MRENKNIVWHFAYFSLAFNLSNKKKLDFWACVFLLFSARNIKSNFNFQAR
jgi:hypothetical protein